MSGGSCYVGGDIVPKTEDFVDSATLTTSFYTQIQSWCDNTTSDNTANKKVFIYFQKVLILIMIFFLREAFKKNKNQTVKIF